MLVVIDSNVIYAGLYSSVGASYRVLELVGDGVIRPAISVGLYEEYRDVIGRPPLANDFSERDRNAFLDYFCSISQLTEVFFLWRPVLKDPKDDLVLEAAVASGAKTIMTYNTMDFDEAKQFGIQVLTPKQYLKKTKLSS